MKHFVIVAIISVAIISIAGSGCARAAKDTSGFALREETVVSASFEDTWQIVKTVLSDQGYEIYTRDKRGAFVAYTPMKRILFVQPKRTKFTVELARVAPEETAISVESVRQIYGVTLLTHPNWHDRKQRDPKASQAILDAIQSTVAAGGVETEPAAEDANAPTPANEAPVVEEAETVKE